MFNIEDFRKIWTVAEEMAELDTVQFVKKPYMKTIQVGSSKDAKFMKRVPISRTEYKDKARDKYIQEIMSLIAGPE